MLATLREAVGLRRFVAVPSEASSKRTANKPKPPEFKQYREGDGRFYFKLVGGDGRVLLQSRAFATGKEAGQSVAALRSDGVAAIPHAGADLGDGVAEQEVAQALAALAAA